jgi:hypothetical protein
LRRAASHIALAVAWGLLAGCLATKYRAPADDAPPAPELGLTAEPFPLEVVLHHVIVYNGPGSWKRDALWDEYVVSLGNRGELPLAIAEVTLTGLDGTPLAPGDEPWKLEAQSQTLEQRYLRSGMAFARGEIPDAIVFGSSAVGTGAGATFSAASATVAAASVYGLPVYYIAVFGVDRSNKARIERQLYLRRLGLPRTLAPGERETGSFFFPMTPQPRSLELHWSDGPGQGNAVLSLASLRGLHDIAGSHRIGYDVP